MATPTGTRSLGLLPSVTVRGLPSLISSGLVWRPRQGMAHEGTAGQFTATHPGAEDTRAGTPSRTDSADRAPTGKPRTGWRCTDVHLHPFAAHRGSDRTNALNSVGATFAHSPTRTRAPSTNREARLACRGPCRRRSGRPSSRSCSSSNRSGARTCVRCSTS